MSSDSLPSGPIFSWGFFARGVPQMLRRRVFGPRPPASTFAPRVQVEPVVALVVCFTLAALSAQSARRGSVVGVLLFGLALVGVLALTVHSAWMARGNPIVPDAFAVGPFIACVLLGGDLGLAIGRGIAIAPLTRIAYAAIGMLAGYIVGSLVGLYTQRLGWIAGFFSLVSFAASAGFILLAVILFV